MIKHFFPKIVKKRRKQKAVDLEKFLVKMDKKPVLSDSRSISVVSVGRNEMLRLPWFLNYYRSIGVNRFFYIDNGSDDGSFEFLLKQGDVHLFRIKSSYLESRAGLDWSKKILDTYCDDKWALIVDIDEILSYPGCEYIHLDVLCAYFDSIGAQALYSVMIDMYPKTSLRGTTYIAGESLFDYAPYFDQEGYYAKGVKQYPGIEIRGGPRERCFFSENEGGIPAPPLKKIPLVRWKKGYCFTSSTHFIVPDIKLADISGVLCHFKFLHDFSQHAALEIARGERWNHGAQYALYLRPFKDNPDFSMFYDGSAKFSSSIDLVNLGLMRPSWSFVEFLKKNSPRSPVIGSLTNSVREWVRSYDTELEDILAVWPAIQNKSSPAKINSTYSDVPLVPSPELAHFSGACEPLRALSIAGWAFDKNNLEISLPVDVYIDEKMTARLIADAPRRDLRDKKLGHGCYGFSFKLPKDLWDGKHHRLSFRISGTDFELRNSPMRISPALLRSVTQRVMQNQVKNLHTVLDTALSSTVVKEVE